MAYNEKPPREVWRKDATSQDVANWALARFARLLAQWGLAYIQQDSPTMSEASKGIRNIATRMEQFERTKVKEWTAAATAQTTSENTHT